MENLKLINGFPFIKYSPVEIPAGEMQQRSFEFLTQMNKRRSVRAFRDSPVPRKVIENIIYTASTAPSGAHKQPWTFCVVCNKELQKQIRDEAEKEEFQSYNGRMPEEWKTDLLPLQTDWKKEFLETAPYLVVVFKKSYEFKGGKKTNTYYATESCGLACGFLLTAIHNAGLVALTHTPSPMNFLGKILNRPVNEKAFLVIPVGYAADDCLVPDIKRKPLNEVCTFYE